MATVRLTRREASRGDLPEVCLVCGEPGHEIQSKNMSWYPPWVIALIVLGLLPFLIGVLLTQQKMHVQLPFCFEHRNYWSRRTLITWLSFLGIVVVGALILAVFVILDDRPGRANDATFGIGCLAWIVLLIGWLVLVVVLHSTSVRPQEIGESFIILKGVDPHFIDALEQQDDREDEGPRRSGRRLRSRERQDSDEDYHQDRRPRAAPDDRDRYREERPPRPPSRARDFEDE